MLGGCGAAGSLGLVLATPAATRNATSTAIQLALVLLALGVLAPLAARRAMGAAEPIARHDAGSGEPTPLWQLPLIVAVLTLAAGLVAGWDAGLRVTGGCLLVGLAQAILLEWMVAARERSDNVCFVRLPGSRIVRGTRLGAISPPRRAAAA